MFNAHLRNLSQVRRWAVLPLIREQSVAEHSFYVAQYAMELGAYIGVSENLMQKLAYEALMHDRLEIWTSDVPGPAKRAMVYDQHDVDNYEDKLDEELLADAFLYPLSKLRARTDSDHATTKLILKVANLIDEFLYLTGEERLGNGAVSHCKKQAYARLLGAIGNLDTTQTHKENIKDAVSAASLVMQAPVRGAPALNTDIQ